MIEYGDPARHGNESEHERMALCGVSDMGYDRGVELLHQSGVRGDGGIALRKVMNNLSEREMKDDIPHIVPVLKDDQEYTGHRSFRHEAEHG
jgi:hypothetical protein